MDKQDLDDVYRAGTAVVDCIGPVLMRHLPTQAALLLDALVAKSDILTTVRSYARASVPLQHRFARATRECGGLDLDSYLLKPFQRLTKYPLLLKEILAGTPNTHPDHGSVKDALAVATHHVHEANERMRLTEVGCRSGDRTVPHISFRLSVDSWSGSHPWTCIDTRDPSAVYVAFSLP